MPDAVVAALAARIRQVQALVGSGAVTGELTDALHRARSALQEVSQSAGRAWDSTAPRWSGPGADAAGRNIAATVAAVEEAAERLGRIESSTAAAEAAIERAHRRLSEIADAFEARAAALEPHLDSPDATAELLAEARRSLAEAVAVVDELRAELDGQAAALPPPAPAGGPSVPAASTTPAAFTAPTAPMGSGAGLESGMGGTPSIAGGFGSLVRDVGDLAQSSMDTPDARTFGDGVALRLPDGSTATAPNAVAASAVRHALTQLGVPYDWGGTAPGVGLDCSGLTQWAYGQAGLSLPRLAQEQDVGAAVDAGALQPGDLAVWDGHVAMVIGNGQMIEAGDPVQISPIRTTNLNQGFQGFWRPTA